MPSFLTRAAAAAWPRNDACIERKNLASTQLIENDFSTAATVAGHPLLVRCRWERNACLCIFKIVSGSYLIDGQHCGERMELGIGDECQFLGIESSCTASSVQKLSPCRYAFQCTFTIYNQILLKKQNKLIALSIT